MTTLIRFFPNLYRDSVALMQLSANLGKQPGVTAASAQMATEANIDLMLAAGLIAERPDPRPNDLLLALTGDDEAALEAAAEFAEQALNEKAGSGDNSVAAEPARSIGMALERDADADLVLISTPGAYAAAEALKALKRGLNVMMFSDNVPVEQEIAVKRYASERGLLVMGPDCGTAIVDGMPLAFANVVRRGPIGVVGASGTGIQQITCLIDQLGSGVSHALGTGGHDLSEAVGGLTMLTAIDQLAKDAGTQIIVLVSKPPAKAVAEKVLAKAAACSKPVVVCFLGADPANVERAHIDCANTLEEAARRAVELANKQQPAFRSATPTEPQLAARAATLAKTLKPGQKFVRGLYSGGTFCYEALLLLQHTLPGLQSNTPTGKVTRLADLWHSQGHTIIDLGDDDFTRGRPHPMIDPTLRLERQAEDAADSGTAIILLDLVLGHGAHADPAGQLAPAIKAAQQKAEQAGRHIVFIGHVCGTDSDPQGLAAQAQTLRDADVELCASNAEAATLVGAIIKNLGE